MENVINADKILPVDVDAACGQITPPRILVVDDEPAIVEEIVESLIAQTIDARGFSNPYEALEVLSADLGITVLLTDINMPGLNGWELTERALTMRSDVNALAVVVLTAHTDVDCVIETIRAGAVDFIRKPAKLGALRIALERAHQKAARQRQLYSMVVAHTVRPNENMRIVENTLSNMATAGKGESDAARRG